MTLTAGVVVVTLTVGLVVKVGLVAVAPGAVSGALTAVDDAPAVVVVVAGNDAIVAVALAAARLELALPRGVETAIVDFDGGEVDCLGEDVVICFCDVKENWGG